MLVFILGLLIFQIAGEDILKRQGLPPQGNNPNPPPLMKLFGNVDDFKVARPAFWPSVLVMLGILLLILVLCFIGLVYHFRSIRRLFHSDASPIQDSLLVDAIDISSLPSAHPPSDGARLRSSESLACAFLNYYVDVPLPWRTKLQETIQGECSLLRSYSKQILSGVTANFRPGTLTAIMGPSGSGKTTLLNILSGRTKKGRMEGYIFLNDMMSSEFAERMRANSGYVMQSDHFFSDLTVEEALLYAALLRLPKDQSLEEKYMRVQQVIREVRLEKVLKTKIGDEFTQGISGGQKRRLSIAIELLNLPSILLLDEPTSGLDANSAHNLVLLLKDLAISHQRTIVTTIHSPRPESFAVFDSILLLGENGTVVYFGPASNAIKYFNNNGFKADSYQSPGDFIIDAVGLNPEVETKDIFDDQMVALDDSEDSNAHLYEEAKLTKPVKSTKVLSSIWNASQEQKELVKDIKKNYLKKNEDEPYKKNTNKIGFWHQTLVLFSRRVSRSGISDQLSLFAQVFSVGIVLAFAFKGQGFEDINIFYRPYKAVMFIVTVTSYAMIVQYLVNVPMFLGERNILRREIENGSSGVGSYILSSLIYEVPISILQVMLLTALGYWLVDLNSEASHVLYYGLVTIIGVAAWQSLVCLASFVTNRIGLVYSICFVFLGLGTLCGGLLIIYHNLPAVFIPFFYSSIPALTYRTLLHNDLQCCYMFLSCTDVDALAVKYVELPPFVAQMDEVCKVNSTTVMNLGGMALQFLDMSNEREAINIAALVGFFLIGRLAAVGIFKIKSYWEYNMKDQTQQDFVGVSKAFLKKKKTGKL